MAYYGILGYMRKRQRLPSQPDLVSAACGVPGTSGLSPILGLVGLWALGVQGLGFGVWCLGFDRCHEWGFSNSNF